LGSKTAGGSAIKIGFLVKQPEEPWFQNEWRFAQECADKYHFTLIKIGAVDGEKVLAAIDNLAAQGAQGFVICTPDVRLGPAIVAKAKSRNLKLFSVDDRFVGADGKFMDVPYMGISASEIGRGVGRALWDEMQRRGWKTAETGACAITFDELDTAHQRTEGAIEALTAAGFPKDHIYTSHQKTTDVPGAFDAANTILTQHGSVKRWLAFGLNDEAVLGAVRAMEGRGISAADSIGVGIGGDTGIVDFRKPKPTGFYGTVLISPRRHGYETAEYMYKWIRYGIAPPKVTLTRGILVTRNTYAKIMREQRRL
jgi:L-arabinose transport system substrate-binding protein